MIPTHPTTNYPPACHVLWTNRSPMDLRSNTSFLPHSHLGMRTRPAAREVMDTSGAMPFSPSSPSLSSPHYSPLSSSLLPVAILPPHTATPLLLRVHAPPPDIRTPL